MEDSGTRCVEEEDNGRDTLVLETDAHEEQTVLDTELEEDIENCGMEDDQGQTQEMLPVPLKNGSEMMDEVGEWVSHSLLLCLPPHLCYLLFVQQHETFFLHDN